MARAIAKTAAFEQSCRERKRIEMLFAHLKRILRLGRLRLRGPAAPSSSSRWQPSPRTCAASPSCWRGRRQRSLRVLRKRRVALKLRGGRWYQSVTAAAPPGASGKNEPHRHRRSGHHQSLSRLLQQNLPKAAAQSRPILGLQPNRGGTIRQPGKPQSAAILAQEKHRPEMPGSRAAWTRSLFGYNPTLDCVIAQPPAR